MKNRLTVKVSIFAILLSSINLLNISVSERALAATAGSGNCIQTVNNSSGVSVYETSGYCYVAFKDVGSRIWTVPSIALTMDYLVVAVVAAEVVIILVAVVPVDLDKPSLFRY